MAMTNQQLYHAVENDTTITKEMTDIFVEFDSTASVSTQAELNSLLVKLYERMKTEDIIVEILGDIPCGPGAFKNWVTDTMDDYTAGLFTKAIA